MSRLILFRGNSRYKVDHAYATPPLIGPTKTRPLVDVYTGGVVTNLDGSPVLIEVNGWERGDTVLFNRALAEQYNRLSQTNPEDDGEEWADLFLDVANNGDKEGEEAFVVVDQIDHSFDSPVAVETAGE